MKLKTLTEFAVLAEKRLFMIKFIIYKCKRCSEIFKCEYGVRTMFCETSCEEGECHYKDAEIIREEFLCPHCKQMESYWGT